MASGMNGQQFQFVGYLPIDNQKNSGNKRVEAESQKNVPRLLKHRTEHQMIESLLKTCKPSTQLCIAVDITGKRMDKTMSVAEGRKTKQTYINVRLFF